MAGGGALFCNTNREFSIPAYPAPTVPSSAPTYAGGQSIGFWSDIFPVLRPQSLWGALDSAGSVVATGYSTSNSTVSVSVLSLITINTALGAAHGTTYAGTSWSAYSGWYYTAPSAPSGLSASGTTSVSLSWGSGGSPDISNTTLQEAQTVVLRGGQYTAAPTRPLTQM